MAPPEESERVNLTSSETPATTNTADVGPPPAYDGLSEPAPVSADPSFTPPAYDVATKLPSYDEAERSKAAEAGFSAPVCPDRAAREARRHRRGFFFWTGPGQFFADSRRDVEDDGGQPSHAQLQQQVLGTELEFLCCFLVALLFNWIGLFVALCCLTVTIAGRAGAISGFGLSVVKWAFLVMHQSYITREALGLTSETSTDPTAFLTDGTTVGGDQNSRAFTISCWLIVALGFLCFLQGIIHYWRAKKCARDYNWLRQRYQSHPF